MPGSASASEKMRRQAEVLVARVSVGGEGFGGEGMRRRCEGGFDASAEVGEVGGSGEGGGARDEAKGDFGFGTVEGGAERDGAGVGDGDEGAGGGVGEVFDVGAIDPEVAGAESVGGAAGPWTCFLRSHSRGDVRVYPGFVRVRFTARVNPCP